MQDIFICYIWIYGRDWSYAWTMCKSISDHKLVNSLYANNDRGMILR